jgi:inner membrane protein
MTDVESPPKDRFAWAASPAGRAGLILLLIGIMQIPLMMVSSLIAERQDRYDEALAGFRRSWGSAQTIAAPVLAVPYLTPIKSDSTATPRYRRWMRIPASQLSIVAKLEPETRQRGFFRAVVYTASVDITGTITVPDINLAEMPSAEVLWNEAVLVTPAADLRGQPADATAEWGGHRVKQTIQSMNGSCGGFALAAAAFATAPGVGTTIPFRTSLVLRGTQSFNLLPNAQQIDLQMSAPWSSPAFTGSSLPLTYAIDEAGFHANWRIAGDAVSNRVNYDAPLSPLCLTNRGIEESLVGVDLPEPVPTYLMVSRAAKYGTLFLALSFLTYFIFEAVSRVRIQLPQYALLGLSVSLFALLLIALAEPLGFTVGYVLATIAVMAQASLYTLSVVRSARLAAMFAGVLGLLFGFLYVVLSLERFSLLVGTLALFAALSVVMVITRHLDWSGRATTRNASVP